VDTTTALLLAGIPVLTAVVKLITAIVELRVAKRNEKSRRCAATHRRDRRPEA